MKLRKLIKGISLSVTRGSLDIEIQGVTANSKEVSFGTLFVAKKGSSFDGALFIREAIEAGAIAVLTVSFDPFLKGVTQLVCSSIEEAEQILAKNFYDISTYPAFKVGITGTNGKTTTSYLIKSLLDYMRGPSGLIGTVEYVVGAHHFAATRTTPDLFTNHKLLHQMGKEGCQSCVMEVTSHALMQGRCAGIDFDVALFTNLTQDHLDYHKTMEEYAKAKGKLFSALGKDKIAIVNADSDFLTIILEHCVADIVTYGFNVADVVATNLVFETLGTHFDVTHEGQTERFFSPLLGKFNVYNALGAIAFGLKALEISLKDLIPLVAQFPQVPGRLERVDNELGLSIFVDFAHTEDGLRNVLETIITLKPTRVITVFGCGGDRDPLKRPKMGQVVALLSDVAIITNDNPRSESPEAIAEQILAGCLGAMVILDRREAIRHAIREAKPDDIVLIAGKGHEKGQTVGFVTTPFDDVLEAKQFCQTINKESLCIS